MFVKKLNKKKIILERIQKIHANIKPFKCNVCDKKNTKKCSLTTHMIVHTTKKEFQYGACNKKIALKRNLK